MSYGLQEAFEKATTEMRAAFQKSLIVHVLYRQSYIMLKSRDLYIRLKRTKLDDIDDSLRDECIDVMMQFNIARGSIRRAIAAMKKHES